MPRAHEYCEIAIYMHWWKGYKLGGDLTKYPQSQNDHTLKTDNISCKNLSWEDT